jgi:hypothetical protein
MNPNLPSVLSGSNFQLPPADRRPHDHDEISSYASSTASAEDGHPPAKKQRARSGGQSNGRGVGGGKRKAEELGDDDEGEDYGDEEGEDEEDENDDDYGSSGPLPVASTSAKKGKKAAGQASLGVGAGGAVKAKSKKKATTSSPKTSGGDKAKRHECPTCHRGFARFVLSPQVSFCHLRSRRSLAS